MTTNRPTTDPRTVMDALKELTEAAGVMLAAEDYQAANERRLLRAAVAAQAFIEAEAALGAAPRAEGLDVERLRAALKSSAEKREWSTEPYAFDQLAEFIAEEYENG